MEPSQPSSSNPEKEEEEKAAAEIATELSAAAKKRRKKKENEKQKNAAAAAAAESAKKTPKHVREMQAELVRRKDAEERIRREKQKRDELAEEERKKLAEEFRLAEEKKQKKKEAQKEKLLKKKQDGTYLTPKQKEERRRLDSMRNQFLSSRKPTQIVPEPEKIASLTLEEPRTPNELRSPICCILGHVDAGKTKLLDCIRGSNVQEKEAGGITQQIGATYFPIENIRERTRELRADARLKVPGLLVIDTPGHEHFGSLRSTGSSLCDIAVLVVDIMHGLQPQTIESLDLLKSRGTRFVVALNKVDRLYGWKSCPNEPIAKAIKQQPNHVKNEFNMRLDQIIAEFREQGLNTALYYKNKEMRETLNIVPTSAISGVGIPDLLLLLVKWAEKTMEDELSFTDKVHCNVLEVKETEGLGITIDVVLINGVLREGDRIVVCGRQGPITTRIRALLVPHPLKELRVNDRYLHHKEIKAAQGVKIMAQGLENAVAGTALYVLGPNDDSEDVKEAVMKEIDKVTKQIDKSGEGVYVQTSTLGSLQGLTDYLKSLGIPFSNFGIGPVHKKDVMKAEAMLEKKKEYAAVLAFDVKIMPDAWEHANNTGVRIFNADIIYHLADQFKAHLDNIREEKKRECASDVVFPCVLKILPNFIFHRKDPILVGVEVLRGIVKVGTPICIPSRRFIDIGKIISIHINGKQVEKAKKGQQVAIKISGCSPEKEQREFGVHFDIDDELVSHISRRSIDILNEHFLNELSMEDRKLALGLKRLFKIA